MRRRPAGYVNLFGALAMLALVVPLALRATMNETPAITEFAPEPQRSIQQAPQEQTSSTGSGAGGAAKPAPANTPSTAPPAGAAVLLACVGDPPRQTEDPQSPPCVPDWSGDNGGATSKGVTRVAITVAMAADGYTPQSYLQDLLTYFNRRFELYGRSLVLAPYSPGGGSPSAQQADAAFVDQQLHAFADAEYGLDTAQGGQGTFYDALAREGILSVRLTTEYTQPGHLLAEAPYEWSYYPDLEAEERAEAALACSSLKSRPAQWAGPGVQGLPRVFGVVGEQSANGSAAYPNTDALVQGLRSCGAQVGPVVQVPNFDQSSAHTAMLQMRSAKPEVTTVLCYCVHGDMGDTIQSSASSEGYYPEWLVNDYLNQGSDRFNQGFGPPDQTAHQFGLTFNNKFLPAAEMPWWSAIQSVDPSYRSAPSWGYERSHYYYETLLELASGIQMAGPRLTPTALRAGLLRAQFPDPGAGSPPLYQALVDYASGNPWMQQDATLIWWNGSAASPQNGDTGTYCYVDLGRRYSLTGWPSEPRFFSGRCS